MATYSDWELWLSEYEKKLPAEDKNQAKATNPTNQDEDWIKYFEMIPSVISGKDPKDISKETPPVDQVDNAKEMEQPEKPPLKTVSNELEDLCNICQDGALDVTWDLYRPNQRDKLDLKVRLALFPESVRVKECGKEYEIIESTTGELKKRHRLVNRVADKIWQQMKHTKTCLRMSIIYLGLVSSSSSASTSSPNGARLSTSFVIRPLFRTMKCLDPKTHSASGKCMIFVDEFGWVYPNWQSFKSNTLYVDSFIIVPENGVFLRTPSGQVILESFAAPKTEAQVKEHMWKDCALNIGALSSAALLASAIVLPVAAPIVWGAAAIGASVSAISTYNSMSELVKRSHHEQDISLWDNDARAHWLAICATVLCFAGSATTSAVRGAASGGSVSKALTVASNAVSSANVVVGGLALGNNLFTAATEEKPLGSYEVLQMSLSLFLFTHSVYNFRTAQQLIQETQSQHIANYKETLSQTGKKNFQKKMNARIKAGGQETAMGDTIRNLNTAEHYNANFKGTAAANVGGGSGSAPGKDSGSIVPSFVKYVPHCATTLLSIYTVVHQNEEEGTWEILKAMAERLLDKYVTSGLSIEWALRDCYRLLRQEAKKKKVPLKETVAKFKEATEDFGSIPEVVRDHFTVFIPETGPLTCKSCGGHRWTE